MLKNILFTYLLFIYTTALIGGIWLQSLHLTSYLFFASGMGIVICCSFLLSQTSFFQARFFYLCTFMFIGVLCGASLYSYKWYCFEQFHKKIVHGSPIIKCTIYALEKTEHLYTKQRMTCYWHEYNAYIYLYTQKTPELRIGDIIQLHDIKCKKPQSIDFARYLLKEGIYAAAFANPLVYTQIARPTWSFRRWLYEWRASLFIRLRQKMSCKSFALFSALFLGNRSYNKKYTDPLSLLFKKWGIAHIYARSGLHLALCIILLRLCMTMIPIAHSLKHSITLVVCLLYASLSWWSISFARALYFFITCQLCVITKQPYRTFHILLLICALILTCNPLQLFFLDFQLSFALTCALILQGTIVY